MKASAAAGPSSTSRRPPRISTGPITPRAALATSRLASVTATLAAASISVAACGVTPTVSSHAPASRQRRDPFQDLDGLQLAVAASAEHPQDARDGRLLAGGDHDRVAERARQAGLLPRGDRVTADVDQHRQVTSELGAGRVDAARRARGPTGDVDQDRRLSEVRGQARLAEVDPFGGGRSNLGIDDNGAGKLRPTLDIRRPAWPGVGVDHDPLPRDSAQHGLDPTALERAGYGNGPDGVTAPSDAEHQDARRARDAGGERRGVRPLGLG